LHRGSNRAKTKFFTKLTTIMKKIIGIWAILAATLWIFGCSNPNGPSTTTTNVIPRYWTNVRHDGYLQNDTTAPPYDTETIVYDGKIIDSTYFSSPFTHITVKYGTDMVHYDSITAYHRQNDTNWYIDSTFCTDLTRTEFYGFISKDTIGWFMPNNGTSELKTCFIKMK